MLLLLWLMPLVMLSSLLDSVDAACVDCRHCSELASLVLLVVWLAFGAGGSWLPLPVRLRIAACDVLLLAEEARRRLGIATTAVRAEPWSVIVTVMSSVSRLTCIGCSGRSCLHRFGNGFLFTRVLFLNALLARILNNCW